MPVKMQHFVEGRLEPFHHANTFAREKTTGPERVRIGPRGGQRYLFGTLASLLGPPYKLLYLLHTSRTRAALGRYESPWKAGRPGLCHTRTVTTRSGTRPSGTFFASSTGIEHHCGRKTSKSATLDKFSLRTRRGAGGPGSRRTARTNYPVVRSDRP
jgi:hypothetical protein